MDKSLFDEKLLKEAIVRASEDDYLKFMTSFKGFHIFSREFERNMNVMIKKYEQATREAKAKIRRLRYLLITLAIILVAVVIILGVEPLRESFFEYSKQMFNRITAWIINIWQDIK